MSTRVTCRFSLLTVIATAFVAASCGVEREPKRRIGAMPETRVEALQVCADGPTVPGIDVSKWQGAIDWTDVHDSGVVFAFIRVSHGTEIHDEYFVSNWTDAESVGVLRGAYQYFSPSQDPIDQADLLLDALEIHGAGELPPVIDVEETQNLAPAIIADRVGQWLSHVETELGVKPIIYTGSYFWNDNVQTDAFADNPLWIAHWGTTCPNLPTAWTDWVFWQTSATGSVPGISGDVDLDVFNGNLDTLLAFAVDPAPPDGSPDAGLDTHDAGTDLPDAGIDLLDAGADLPDAGTGPPDAETDLVDPDGSDASSTPTNPSLTRFAEVPDSGLDDSHCQVGGQVSGSGWLVILAILATIRMRRRGGA